MGLETIDFTDESIYVQWYKSFTDAYYDPNIRFIFMKWGAGSGKSKLITQILCQNLDEYKILGVRKVKDTIKDSIHSEFKWLINSWWLKGNWWDYIDSPMEVRYNNDVKVIYRWIDDQEKLKSIEGIDQVWIEEATELQYDDFDQLDLRTRSGKNNKIIVSFNPINAQSWLKLKVEDQRDMRKKDSVWIESTPFMNQFLPQSYLDSLMRKKDTNPSYFAIYAENKRWQGMKWLIYPDYKVFDHDIEPDYIWLDFWYNDPCAMTYLKVEDKSEKKDLYIWERIYISELTSASLIAEMQRIGVSKRVLIVADSARPEMIRDIKNAGYNIIPVDKWKWSVQDQINAVQEYNLYIRWKNAIKEISSYCWKLDKWWNPLDVPLDWDDHICDSFRYWATQYKRNKIVNLSRFTSYDA